MSLAPRATGVGLADLHHRHAVAAGLGRQVEVGDFGELALQQRDEQLVHRQPEHGRLVGRFAGVGGVVDGVLPQRDALDREHREFGALVVIAGVVAVRAFQRVLPAAGVVGVGEDVAFEHDFGAGRDLERHAERGRDLGARAAQQAGELVHSGGQRRPPCRGSHE